MNSLVKELIKPLLEESQKVIGIFGGGFKPVTKGHFDAVKTVLENNSDIDEFIIYVGKGVRDNIDQNQSLLVWDIYSKYLPMKVKIEPVESPVKSTLNYIKEHPQEKIYWVLGARDEIDYKDIERRTKSIKQNPNVEIKQISGLNTEISGTKVREAILNNNNKLDFFNYIPDELSNEDKEKVWDIVKPIVDENLQEAKQAGVLYHYTLLDYLVSIVNDNALKALGTTTFGPIISFTRDKNFHKVKRHIMGTECRIVIDGDKLSNNYKITPIAEKDFRRNTNDTESEERITFISRNDEIKNLDKYIISYDIFLDKVLDDEDAISMLLYLRKDFAKKRILNVNYYMNNKLLSNDEVEELINSKSSSSNIVESQLNNNDYKKFLLYIDKLLNYCCEDLQIERPKVIIINNDKYTQENRSFGGYMPGENKIYLVIKNRNLSDCARSLAHELRHHWKFLNDMIKPGDGKDGDNIENDANAYAGKIMRKFGRENPEIFTLIMVENKEENKLKINKLREEYTQYALTELFEKDLPNINKISNTEYIVGNGDDIEAKYYFKFEDWGNKYSLNWSFTDNNKNNSPEAWKQVTATSFKIIDDFINNNNPSALYISGNTGAKTKLYKNYADKLQILLNNKYKIDNSDEDRVVLRSIEEIVQSSIKKRMETLNESYEQALDYWQNGDLNSKSKIERWDVIKRKVKREVLQKIYNIN